MMGHTKKLDKSFIYLYLKTDNFHISLTRLIKDIAPLSEVTLLLRYCEPPLSDSSTPDREAPLPSATYKEWDSNSFKMKEETFIKRKKTYI